LRRTRVTLTPRTTGGLAILGTERHESRRIDNQLRGLCSNSYHAHLTSISNDFSFFFMVFSIQYTITKAAKYRAVVRNAVERHKVGQPLLIGTTSILKI